MILTYRSNTNTYSSGHQHSRRSHEGEHKLPTEHWGDHQEVHQVRWVWPLHSWDTWPDPEQRRWWRWRRLCRIQSKQHLHLGRDQISWWRDWGSEDWILCWTDYHWDLQKKYWNMKFNCILIFIFPSSPAAAERKITVMIKADGTDSKQVSSNPTSWSKIFFFFFPSAGFLTRR